MIYSALYHKVDFREANKGTASLPVQLKPTPGGLLYFEAGADVPKKLEWDDDDPDAFIDNEAEGTLIIVTKDGTIMFQKIESPA